MEIFDENYKEYKLDNGLVVALQKTPIRTIAGQLSVYWGYANEKENEIGLTHFLEHVLIKGGTDKYSSEEVDNIFNSFGYANGISRVDETIFPVDMLSEDLEKYLNLISSIVFNPRLDKIKIEQERQRILREIASGKSGLAYIDGKNFREAIYPKNHPFILDGFGKEAVINSAKQENLKDFHLRGYNARNMELVLTGNLLKNTEELIKKYFGDKPSGESKKFQFPLIDSLEKKVIMHTSAPDIYNQENPEENNSYIDLLVFVPPIVHKDWASLCMLRDILGVGMESRLHKKISQEAGLAYTIVAHSFGECNIGVIKIESNVISKKQEEAINLIFDEFKKLQDSSIDLSELEFKKRKARYEIEKSFETNQGCINIIRRKLVYNINVENVISEITSLTPEKIQEAAIKYLPKDRNGNYALLIRDPLKK